MRRGEVWWAELQPPAKRRPVVLLTRDRAIEARQFLTVATVTTRERKLPVEVALEPEDGLPKSCVMNADDIVTIDKRRLLHPISLLSPEKMRLVGRAVKFALGLE